MIPDWLAIVVFFWGFGVGWVARMASYRETATLTQKGLAPPAKNEQNRHTNR